MKKFTDIHQLTAGMCVCVSGEVMMMVVSNTLYTDTNLNLYRVQITYFQAHAD
jgi:hypothetical protein